MQIQSGKLYKNKAWKYLYPCLKDYGIILKNHLNTFYKLGVGVDDDNHVPKEENSLYILLDTKISTSTSPLFVYRENLAKFLDWFRNQSFYVADYIYGGLDSHSGEQHMIVIRVPEKHYKSLKAFKEGKYSEMYNEKEILEYFQDIEIPNKEIEQTRNLEIGETRDILNKRSSYLPKFRNLVNKEFGTTCTLEDLKNHELDVSPFRWEEVFNYKPNQNGTRIKIQ